MPILNLADFCVVVLLIYYIVGGWRRGFWLSTLGPVSFLGCSILAYHYYKEDHNLYLGCAVVFFGPVIIRLIVWLVMWVFQEEGKKVRPALFSSILGTAVSLIWGIGITALMLLMLAISPEGFNVPVIKAEVLSSRSYGFLANQLAKAWPGIFDQTSDSKTVVASGGVPGSEIVMSTDEERKRIEAIPEYQTLMKDDRIVNIVEDPQILEMIKAKNYSALLADEKFSKVLEDPQLIIKLLQLYRKMGQQLPAGADSQPAFTPEMESFPLPSENDDARNFSK